VKLKIALYLSCFLFFALLWTAADTLAQNPGYRVSGLTADRPGAKTNRRRSWILGGSRFSRGKTSSSRRMPVGGWTPMTRRGDFKPE
jgi:hypothetical protein